MSGIAAGVAAQNASGTTSSNTTDASGSPGSAGAPPRARNTSWSDTVATGENSSGPTQMHVGPLPSGRYDGITDVPGVLVNNFTKISGTDVRDGATVVMPNADPWMTKAAAATYAIDGNGGLTNDDKVNASGRLDTPIVLCTAPNAGRAYDATLQSMEQKHPEIGGAERIPLPVVATIDGRTLTDGAQGGVAASEFAETIAGAHGGQFARGSVGAGTPAVAFDYKAGIGSSSRVLPLGEGGYTVGVLVNANTEKRENLVMAGVPVGRYLPQDDLPQTKMQPNALPTVRASGGGIDVVVATDAPLNAQQLRALAKRTAVGLYRTGAISPSSGGAQVIAFSTSRVTLVDDEDEDLTASTAMELTDKSTLSDLYAAAADATESAIDNSLLASSTMTGRGSTVFGLPKDDLRKVLAAPPPVQVQGSSFVAPLAPPPSAEVGIGAPAA